MSGNSAQSYREQIERFLRLRDSDPQGALAYARRALEEAPVWRRNHPERGDALELMALARMQLEDWEMCLDAATELVRVRRNARPVDHALVALALGVQATALFACGETDKADETLREHLAEWRKALPFDDIRLAQKLENHAEHVAGGFGRARSASELLAEAAAIREANPEPSRGRLAGTLQQLALQQIRLCDYPEAERNLRRASDYLEREIDRDPSEENNAGLAQLLVLRCAIAGKSGRIDEAAALAEAARSVPLHDRVLRAETEMLVAGALSKVFEMTGDLRRAVEEQSAILAVFERNEDLLSDGRLDRAMIGDVLLALAGMFLQMDELRLAGKHALAALPVVGKTSGVFFLFSELRRKGGRSALALRHYQRALRLRKEAATEMLVLFGTNRERIASAERVSFGGRSGAKLSLGWATVLVPGAQFSTKAWMESPAWPKMPVSIEMLARLLPAWALPERLGSPASLQLPTGRATDSDALVIRPDTPVLGDPGFSQRARAAVNAAQLYPKAALVFIHGFNVTFENALRRGAQLVRDLNFDGAAFVFSWPSRGLVNRYGTDRKVADQAATRLSDFLRQVEEASGAETIHLIAHSMGNRVILPGLLQAVTAAGNTLLGKIGEVVLAAPAVPIREFMGGLDKLTRLGLRSFTLYASAVDRAMQAGWIREGRKVLAGYVADGLPVLHPNLESIDVTEGGGINFLNHDVFASNPVMTEDIRKLLQTRQRPPHLRLKAFEAHRSASGVEYWRYRVEASPR